MILLLSAECVTCGYISIGVYEYTDCAGCRAWALGFGVVAGVRFVR